MIAPLRRLHRRCWSLLAVTVPVLIGAAWTVRPKATLDAIPALPSDAHGAALAFDTDTAIGVATSPRSASVLLIAESPLALAYFARGATDGTRLPDDAVLLGPLSTSHASEVTLPAGLDPDANGGTLLLYSLGHHEVFARAPFPLPVN